MAVALGRLFAARYPAKAAANGLAPYVAGWRVLGLRSAT